MSDWYVDLDVSGVLGDLGLPRPRSGRIAHDVRMRCPFCGGRNDSKFCVDLEKDGYPAHCWGCDWRGNIASLTYELIGEPDGRELLVRHGARFRKPERLPSLDNWRGAGRKPGRGHNGRYRREVIPLALAALAAGPLPTEKLLIALRMGLGIKRAQAYRIRKRLLEEGHLVYVDGLNMLVGDVERRDQQSDGRSLRLIAPTHSRPPTPSLDRETCAHGHPWTEENVYIRPNGKSECRSCRSKGQKDLRRRKFREKLDSMSPVAWQDHMERTYFSKWREEDPPPPNPFAKTKARK